jgi:hypothetical protein
MELLGDLIQVEARFSPFGDCLNLSTGLVHRLRRTCHSSEIILRTNDGTSR